MERSKGEDEIVDNGGVLTLTKRKRPAIDGASSGPGGDCPEDTVENILVRLPARTAIACTTLSKHHRSLIRSPEFRRLHCRLGAPLPTPHVAYIATAAFRTPAYDRLASQYYGFHLAGAGLGGSGDAPKPPIRSVAGWRYLGTEYVNTCNGVLLLATNGFSKQCRCILWNPAISDVAREVTIPKPTPERNKLVMLDGTEVELRCKETQLLPLGLGYGRRSKTYKLLLCRKNSSSIYRGERGYRHLEYSLLVYSLRGPARAKKSSKTQLRAVSSFVETGQSCSSKEKFLRSSIFKNNSLYMDDKIYLLHTKKHEILAFDVEDETVCTIEAVDNHGHWVANSDLIEMSGRPCLVIIRSNCIALWKLTVNEELEPIHAISYTKQTYSSFYRDHTIVGIWDCGGILFLWFENKGYEYDNRNRTDQLLLYDVTAKKILRAYMPRSLTHKKSEYMLCWGYKPTLVSPESIVGEFNQDMENQRGRSAHITEVINPLLLQDKRNGLVVTLNIVCLMEFLVRIMQKLPHDMQDVVEMQQVDSEEPGSLFECVVSLD